jgi:hypothetical protein
MHVSTIVSVKKYEPIISPLTAAAILVTLKSQTSADLPKNLNACYFCPFIGKKTSSLANHLKSHAGALPYTCPCGLRYKNPELLKQHQEGDLRRGACPELEKKLLKVF